MMKRKVSVIWVVILALIAICRMCVCGGDILSLREAAGATISAERAASHS